MTNPIGPIGALAKALDAYARSQNAVKSAAADVRTTAGLTESAAAAHSQSPEVTGVHPQQ
jgi:phage-related minor tail protein